MSWLGVSSGGLPVAARRGTWLTGGPKPIASSGRPLQLCPSRQQLVIPKNSSAKKQPVAGQRQGKPVPKGQASQQSQAQAAKPQSCREEAATGGGGIAEKILAEITVTKLVKAKPSRCPEALSFITPVTAVLSASNSEANLLEEPTHAVLRQLPPRLRQQKE